MEPASPAWAGGFFITEPPGKPSTTGNRSQRITTQVKQRHAILYLREAYPGIRDPQRNKTDLIQRTRNNPW